MSKRKLTKVIISVIVIGSAVGYLLYLSAESSWAYYYSVDEFLDSYAGGTSGGGQPTSGKINHTVVRIAGRVKGGSIRHSMNDMQLDFELAGKKKTLAVRYSGTVPAGFEAGREVLVEGTMQPQATFKADKILTRCESKYKAKLKEQETVRSLLGP